MLVFGSFECNCDVFWIAVCSQSVLGECLFDILQQVFGLLGRSVHQLVHRGFDNAGILGAKQVELGHCHFKLIH